MNPQWLPSSGQGGSPRLRSSADVSIVCGSLLSLDRSHFDRSYATYEFKCPEIRMLLHRRVTTTPCTHFAMASRCFDSREQSEYSEEAQGTTIRVQYTGALLWTCIELLICLTILVSVAYLQGMNAIHAKHHDHSLQSLCILIWRASSFSSS